MTEAESVFDLSLESLQYDKENKNLEMGWTDAETLEKAYVERYDRTAYLMRSGHMRYWMNQQLSGRERAS